MLINDELNNTSTARLMPPRKISNPVYIRIEDLEAFQESQQSKQRIQTQKSPHGL